MKTPKQRKDTERIAEICIISIAVIIITQIPIIKTYLKMITLTECIVTIVITAVLYKALELIYKKYF